MPVRIDEMCPCVSMCVITTTGSDGFINPFSTEFLCGGTVHCFHGLSVEEPNISVHEIHVVRSDRQDRRERERETNHIMNGSAYGHRQLDRYRHGHQLDMERKLTVTIITV